MKTKNAKIYYLNPFDELESRESKLEFLKKNQFKDLEFEQIFPDKKHNWLNQSDNDWEKLLPMGTKECKLNQKENAIFKLFSNGVVTARDEWVYDFEKENLESKIKFLIAEYNQYVNSINENDIKNINDFVHSKNIIKWTRHLKNQLSKKKKIDFTSHKTYSSLYRPFIKKYLYFDKDLNEMQYQQALLFPTSESENIVINLNASSDSNYYPILANRYLVDFAFLKMGNGGTQSFPLYIYKENQKIDNITEFGLKSFQNHYNDKSITKREILSYCYGVLHNSDYRKKYEINLKQDLPRIPFYTNFKKIAEIGAKLIELHCEFESIEPYPLVEKNIEIKTINKTKLKLSKDKDEILIDEITTLSNFPKEALEYKLGNRSAIEWVLDGYKEKNVKDPTVKEKFDNYKFSDYKDEVIELLKRVTTVSLKSIELIGRLSN